VVKYRRIALISAATTFAAGVLSAGGSAPISLGAAGHGPVSVMSQCSATSIRPPRLPGPPKQPNYASGYALSKSDMWMVGQRTGAGAQSSSVLAVHWDGTRWGGHARG
jgi:hypothetical protein